MHLLRDAGSGSKYCLLWQKFRQRCMKQMTLHRRDSVLIALCISFPNFFLLHMPWGKSPPLKGPTKSLLEWHNFNMVIITPISVCTFHPSKLLLNETGSCLNCIVYVQKFLECQRVTIQGGAQLLHFHIGPVFDSLFVSSVNVIKAHLPKAMLCGRRSIILAMTATFWQGVKCKKCLCT